MTTRQPTTPTRAVPPQIAALRRSLARAIRHHAARRDLSINMLADRSGVSRAQIYNVLAGECSPSLEWLDHLACALNVKVTDFFDETGEAGP
jgi:transcriptional regulator with XRE-family HTH domain